MINEKKIINMTKLQAFEDTEGKKVFSVVSYFRSDYISIQLLKGFMFYSVAAIVVLAMWGLFNMEEFMESINTMDYLEFAKDLLLRYLAGLLAYLSVVYIYSVTTYSRARKKGRKYHRRLKEVSKQ